jgi:hypothetical protein
MNASDYTGLRHRLNYLLFRDPRNPALSADEGSGHSAIARNTVRTETRG